VDLSIQEQAQAVARLHALRKKQNPEQNLTATTLEIYDSPTAVRKVREQLMVASHLDMPEVSNAKTLKEAVKAIEKKQKLEHRAELAKTFDLSVTEHKLIHGSALELAKDLPDGKFDLILTDPPYGISADAFGSQSSGHNYRDDYDYAIECYSMVAVEGFRVTKPHASCYAFCHIGYFEAFAQLFRTAGWIVWERPLIWSKGNGMLPKPDFGPRNTYEAIIFAYKPDTKIVLQGQADVLTHRVGTGLEHGAQKPVELYAELIQRSANPSAHVLDFFAGSGTIFPAANKTQVYATGFELVDDNFNLALSRMTETEKDILDEV
jgi:DNA modification methylase